MADISYVAAKMPPLMPNSLTSLKPHQLRHPSIVLMLKSRKVISFPMSGTDAEVLRQAIEAKI